MITNFTKPILISFFVLMSFWGYSQYEILELNRHETSEPRNSESKYIVSDINKAVNSAVIESTNFATVVLHFNYSISGMVFNDVNGLTDDQIDGPGTNADGTLKAALYNKKSGIVEAVTDINPNGSYSFDQIAAKGNFTVYLTNSMPVVGQTAVPTITMPAGWVNIGEKLGLGNGSDTKIDGILFIGVPNENVENANFGIEQLPTAGSGVNIESSDHDGEIYFPQNTFTNINISSDPSPGGVKKIKITGWDTEYIFIDGVVFASVGQIEDSGYPGGIPADANGNPLVTFSLYPVTSENKDSVSIYFKAIDAAGKKSINTGKATIKIKNYIVGQVFNDANGLNGIPYNKVDGTPTNAGGLNAVLINTTSGLVVASEPVDNFGYYGFDEINDGNFTIQITTNPATINSLPPALALPDGWVNTGEQLGTAIGNDGVADGILRIPIKSDIDHANFGIERLPNSKNVNVSITQEVSIGNNFILDGRDYYIGVEGSTSLSFPPLEGSDPEDGKLGARNSVQITTLPNNSLLIYDGLPITEEQIINNYDPSLLSLTLTSGGSKTIIFEFAFLDEAGKSDPTPATYTINYVYVLPIQLISFTSKFENSNSILDWTTSNDQNIQGFGVEHSTNGNKWNELSYLKSKSKNGNTNEKIEYQFIDIAIAKGTHFYRLKQTEINGKFTYSNITKVINNSESSILQIYPNPVNSHMFVEYHAEKTLGKIIDITGRVVKTFFTSGLKTIVETTNLQQGTYLVLIGGNALKIVVIRQ